MNGAWRSAYWGHREGTARWKSIRPRILGLPWRPVGRASVLPERKTPPDLNPAARRNKYWGVSRLDQIAALAVLGFGGGHGQTHFLPDRAGQESPDGMRLPAGGFDEFSHGVAALPSQEFQDLGGLAAASGGVRFLSGFGRFLRGGGLLGRLHSLGRNVGATWGTTGLFLRLGTLHQAWGLGFPDFFCSRCGIFHSPCAVITAAVRTSIPLFGANCKRIVQG